MPQPRILVVEDDGVIMLELLDRLQRLGYQMCGKTNTAEDAVILAEGLRPDLVLMDIRLKGAMDGIEAAARIRANQDVPVVYLTAYADEQTVRRAQVTQPYGYIIKPFQERELRTTIEMALYKHQVERQLHERERWLDTTLCSIGDAVVATDQQGNVVFMNGVAERLTGQTEAEARQRPAAALLPLALEGSGVPVPCPALGVLRQGQPHDLAGHVLLRPGRPPLDIDGSATPIRDERGGLQGVVLAFRDASQRKREQQERERLQARLYEAEQSEVLGVLAGDLLHDLNKAFTTIAGCAALVAAGLDSEVVVTWAERAEAAAWLAARQARQVLAVHREQMPDPQVLDLNVLLAGLVETVTRQAGEQVAITWSLSAAACPVLADATQVGQAIANLVDNALEAMPHGGTLTIQTERAPAPASLPGHAGDVVHLAIADTGPGIEPEVRARLFEPFFTFGKPGATGLGLSVARGIVFYHGGWIDLDSAPGQGTTCHVYLPAAAPPAAHAAETLAPPSALPSLGRRPFPWTLSLPSDPVLSLGPCPSAPGRDQGGTRADQVRGKCPRRAGVPPVLQQGKGERVLLVEENDGLRLTVADMLEAGGYQVLAAATAVTGLEALETEDATVDLLLAGVTLPDWDGLWLADRCRAHQPGLPVLLTSAHADNRSRWMEIGQRGLHFLPQPFSLTQLLHAVRGALARDEAGNVKRET